MNTFIGTPCIYAGHSSVSVHQLPLTTTSYRSPPPAIAHHHALTPTNGTKKTRNMDHNVVVEPVGATFRQNSSNRFYYSSSCAGVNSAQVKSDTWIISNNVILLYSVDVPP